MARVPQAELASQPSNPGTKGEEGRRPATAKWRRPAAYLLTWAGSGLVAVSAVIHFHLWESAGYGQIPTIGPLFLMQAVAGAVVALWTSIVRYWLLALAEAGFALATVGGFLISVNVGLFGWQDTMTAPFATLALSVELAATFCLAAAGAILLPVWLAEHPKGRRLRALLPGLVPRRAPARHRHNHPDGAS